MLSVPLTYREATSPAHQVEFRREDLRRSQARLQNRYALVPRINLKQFLCKAVIDFVEVEIVTKNSTNFPAIRRWISSALSLPSPWCEQVGGEKNSATTFHIVIHDPRIADLERLDGAIAKTAAGLAQPTKITKLEISIDFYPHSGSEEDRLAMFGVLQRTYMPSKNVWTKNRDHPRFQWSEKEKPTFFLPSSIKRRLHHQLSPEAAFLDSTVYYWEKTGPASIRIQNKITNNRNKDRFIALPQEDKRARIEVTLTGSALSELKLRTIADLARFSFTKLQGEHFHFALPTFVDRARLSQYQKVQEAINLRDRESFAKGGVLCLERLRDVREEWFKRVGELKARGITPSLRRMGKGDRGTTVAYVALNEMVRTAFQELGRRIARRERRS
ncbi:hypothetical protein [Tabrizicola sp. M-4]|uniref:hypothetical protein n=1 Tax=Tabrizicola sp. M-4 TaxID=3055847 RepID=UPI003DA7E126